MQKYRQQNVGIKSQMKLLLILLIVVSSSCMDQTQNDVFMIDEKIRQKTAHNLKENIESIKENSNPSTFLENSPLLTENTKILTDQHEKSSTAEKKPQLKIDNNIHEIIELNEINFPEFLSQNIHVVINFYTKQCQYCYEFKRSLEGIRKRLSEQSINVKIGSLQLTDSTQHIFKEYNIQVVPEIRYFYQSKPSKYLYNFIEYFGEQVSKLAEWIIRLCKVSEFQNTLQMSHKMNTFGKLYNLKQLLYIKEVESLQEIANKANQNMNEKVIMMNCSYQWKETENKDLGQFLKKSYLTHLDHDFYCTQNSSIFSQSPASTFISLPTNQIFLYVYEFKFTQGWSTQNPPTLLSRIRLNNNISYKLKQTSSVQNQNHLQYTNLTFIYHENMKRYFNQKVQYWTNQSVLNVFTHNNPCFIMIINNQTVSKRLFMKYEEIKQKLVKNPKFPPIKFYYTDLSLTAQSTTRIKKYISGLKTSISQYYPYPLLAYLKPIQNRVKKFLYEGQKTYQGMEKWIVDIINQIEIQSEPIKEQETSQTEDAQKVPQTKQYFRTTPESLFPAHYTQKFRSIYRSSQYSMDQKSQKLKIPQEFIRHRNDLKFINFYDMQILLSNLYPKDFFVYVNWKNQINAYEILSEITEWWGSLDDKQQKRNKKEIIKSEQKNTDNKVQGKQGVINNNQDKQAASSIPNQVQKQKTTEIAENVNTQRKLIEKDPKKQQFQPHSIQQRPEHLSHQYSQEQKLTHFAKKTNIYILNYNNNDYPPEYWDSQGQKHDLKISHVPSIVYFSADRKRMDKIEGIFHLQQVKMFILHQYKLKQNTQIDPKIDVQKRQSQKTPKVSNTESAERQLSVI